MKKILILFAHPAIQKSRINRKLAEAVQNLEWVTFNDLYDNYPDFYIDIVKEQQLLLLHDIIVWHHPFYWYSSPALLKEWFDLVLQYGFAYGENGNALQGKTVFSVITTGGRPGTYSEKDRNKFQINQFLTPFKQSAKLCRMNYLPPFVVHGANSIPEKEVDVWAEKYKKLLTDMRDENFTKMDLRGLEYLNELTNKNV